MRKLCGYFGRDEGQTMAEYGVVLTVITIASLTALTYLSESIGKRVTAIASYLT